MYDVFTYVSYCCMWGIMKLTKFVIVGLWYSWSNGTAVFTYVNICADCNNGCQASTSTKRGLSPHTITAGNTQHQRVRVYYSVGINVCTRDVQTTVKTYLFVQWLLVKTFSYGLISQAFKTRPKFLKYKFRITIFKAESRLEICCRYIRSVFNERLIRSIRTQNVGKVQTI
jgi:hypothetical protein